MSQVLVEESWEIEDLIENLVTEDDEPVDNILSAKQQRLLTETLYSSWKPSPSEEDSDEPRNFFADANVGKFFYSFNISKLKFTNAHNSSSHELVI